MWIAGLSWAVISELRRHRLADDDRAGLAQTADGGSIRFGPPAGENWRAALGRIVGGIEDVLNSDGNAVQRPDASAVGLVAVERARLGQCMLAIDVDEGLDIGLDRRDAPEAGARVLLGRQRAARDFGSNLRGRQCGRVESGQVSDSSSPGAEELHSSHS
jgi:hypothetical protein